MRRLSISFILGMLIIFSACVPEDDNGGPENNMENKDPKSIISTSSPEDLEAEMQAVMGNIERIIGQAHCDDSSQCAALPIGAKPCGGPWRYLPFSTRDMDVDRLHDLAGNYNKLNEKYNQQTGIMSDCMLTPRPTALCINNECKLQAAVPPVLQ